MFVLHLHIQQNDGGEDEGDAEGAEGGEGFVIDDDADDGGDDGLDGRHYGRLAVFKPHEAAGIQQVRQKAGHKSRCKGKAEVGHGGAYDGDIVRAADDGRANGCKQAGVEIYRQARIAAV